ncbi:hypothetical protein BGZ99_005714 [Dissophora globulifera]|uniref:Uncharacterized protein n=1 Tax=Dissophora globulifera TaxID=979702 RepID=A0A9P6RE44_9FUNG|nr:hypothetical protein BGZ99_005714 [Dissophora globulifera]
MDSGVQQFFLEDPTSHGTLDDTSESGRADLKKRLRSVMHAIFYKTLNYRPATISNAGSLPHPVERVLPRAAPPPPFLLPSGEEQVQEKLVESQPSSSSCDDQDEDNLSATQTSSETSLHTSLGTTKTVPVIALIEMVPPRALARSAVERLHMKCYDDSPTVENNDDDTLMGAGSQKSGAFTNMLLTLTQEKSASDHRYFEGMREKQRFKARQNDTQIAIVERVMEEQRRAKEEDFA